MPIIHIPPTSLRRWTGPYLGDYYGVLWKTSNIDLDRRSGKILLSRRMERIEDTTENTESNQWAAFLRTDADCTDRYWALAYGGSMIKTDSATPENAVLPSDDWDTDPTASSPSTGRDFTVGGNDSRNDSGRNKLFVTTSAGDISVLNDSGNNAWTASWWQTKQSQPALTGNVLFRPIQYFPYVKKVLVGSGNLIHTIQRPSDTQNDTLSYARLVMPKNLNARHIFSTSSRAWILTDHRYGGEAKIVEWDGFTETYNDIHSAYGVSALAGVSYKETPIVLNDKGAFLEYNGSGFQPMIRNGQKIALPLAEGASLISGADTSMTSAVMPRGMVVGEDGLVYVNVSQATIASERFVAGIWCLDPLSGRLYRKTGLGKWGDSTDFGHSQMSAPGGLYYVPSSVSTRNLLSGGLIQTTAAGGVQNGLWLQEADTSTLITRGYFITQYVPADEIRNSWDAMWLKFRQLITAGQSIIVKARGTRSLVLTNRRPLQGTITWTSTTTFTLTLASGDDQLAVGDEVEVLNGSNAGYLAHITVISGAHAALQTITIDETVATGSSTSIARFERWKKCGTVTSQTKYEEAVNIGIDSSFIQYKVELRGLASEMELAELVASYEPNLYNQK